MFDLRRLENFITMGEIFIGVDKKIEEIEKEVSKMVEHFTDLSKQLITLNEFADELKGILTKKNK
ncbi:hypothetical protein NBO_204g0001 [Nosema bombycis CQ1]|uniref:Uncharacterized protein n=1 Tax=Nosema bombycis (strain CQ1 / CVCC 102059) TaxID=578461 RepID=R0MG19_NOSB1|nr:hypothetical protein NBO_204g0001 [Nosema bombycis CQ1]|eukprot:EOB13080.1 hypothetical protein NBO_204g0001 [Nosema bombycis CQ1]